MKFTIVSALSLAATAAATPFSFQPRTNGTGDGGEGSPCSNDQEPVCCASLIGITCLIDVLGGACDGGSYCCNSGGSAGVLININLLNCAKIL